MKPYQEARCVCGSGLRSRRCCDLSPAYVAPPVASEQASLLVGRATEALASGNAAAAETLCLNALDVAPRLPGALWILYQIRNRADQQQAAMALLKRLVALQPNDVDATQELAMLLFQLGDLIAAEQHARNAVRLAPANPRSHNLLGMILTEAQRHQTGEYHYRRVLEICCLRQSASAPPPDRLSFGSAATGLFNAASDWADYCVITIRRQPEGGRRLI